MALTLQDVDRIIKHAQPELLKRLDLNLLLVAELQRTDVITDSLYDTLELKSLTRHEKIVKLLDGLRIGPVERYLRFCQVLHTCGQKHVLCILKVDIVAVEVQLACIPEQPLDMNPAGATSQTDILGKTFPEQCEYYESKLALSPIYEYVSRSPLVHLDDMFTNLQLVNNEKDQGISKHSSKGKASEPIHLRDVFEQKGKPVLSIIIEGRPGSGKSTVLRHCAVDWARNKGRTTNQVKDPPLVDKDLLIFVDKNDEGETLDDTILNAIKGDKNTKRKSFHYMKTYPKRTFIFVDGLDEFLRQEIRDEILKLAKDCGINIVVTCRLGHPYLEKNMQCFNRHIRIEGFDSDSMDTFVKSFMRVLSIQKNNKSIQQKSETLCTLLKVKDTQNVYSTPMNCTFLCILYAEGEVTDDELATLTMRDLYMKQQDLLLKREFARTAHLNGHKTMDTEAATINGIHRMALHALVHTEKQSRYSAEDAVKFGIDLNSPAMVMLQVDQDGPRKMFQWPHQTIKEFHAANAVKNSTIMYLIASRAELNEVTRFIVSSLIKSDPEFVKELITAVLLLQSTDPACTRSKWKKVKHAFSKHACTEILMLKKYLKEQDIDDLLLKDSDVVASVVMPKLDKIQACLRGSDWLLKNNNVLEDLKSISWECPTEEDSRRLLADVIHPFLPSFYSGCDEDELHNFDEDEEETLSERVSNRVSKIGRTYRTALLPAAGDNVYSEMLYQNPGLASKFKAYKESEAHDDDADEVDEEKHNCVSVHLGSIKDAITDISHPSVAKFSKKCGSIDWVGIEYLEEADGPADNDLWTAILTELKRIFRPKKGINLQECCTNLTQEEMVELSKLLRINVSDNSWPWWMNHN